MLSRCPAEGAGRAGRPVPPHRPGRPGGPPDTARVHPGRLGRPAQRHAPDAFLPGRSRARPRRRRRPPGGERCRRAGGGGGVRQAARRDRRRRARERHTGGRPLRRPDQARDRPRDGRPDRSRVGLPGGRPGRGGARPVRAARLSRPGQLRGHVHLQHDADVHRRAGARTAAHGLPALGRSAPADRVPRPGGRLPARHDEPGHPAPRHRHTGVAAQRPDGRHRHGRLHERAAAQRRDRPRRGHRPVGRRAEPGRLQPAGPAPAGAGRHATVRRLLHGRRGRQGRAAGHREGAPRGRLPRR